MSISLCKRRTLSITRSRNFWTRLRKYKFVRDFLCYSANRHLIYYNHSRDCHRSHGASIRALGLDTTDGLYTPSQSSITYGKYRGSTIPTCSKRILLEHRSSPGCHLGLRSRATIQNAKVRCYACNVFSRLNFLQASALIGFSFVQIKTRWKTQAIERNLSMLCSYTPQQYLIFEEHCVLFPVT